MEEQILLKFFNEVTKYLDDHIKEIDFVNISVGKPIEIATVKDKPSLFKAAAHCVINGPVGINKETNFPLINKTTSIKNIVGQKVTSTSWRNFCTLIALYISVNIPDIYAPTRLKGKDLWPLNDPKAPTSLIESYRKTILGVKH
jgi:hypothetical protein